jgi:hypothetical protein
MGMGNMDMHAMMLVKRACELFADEFQQEISEVMYRQVNSKTAEAIAAAFCPKILEPLAPTRPKKKKVRRQAGQGQAKKREETLRLAKLTRALPWFMRSPGLPPGPALRGAVRFVRALCPGSPRVPHEAFHVGRHNTPAGVSHGLFALMPGGRLHQQWDRGAWPLVQSITRRSSKLSCGPTWSDKRDTGG